MKGWPGAAYNESAGADDGTRVQQWCADHGLEQVCLDMLLSLPVETREEVMACFAPRPGTRNPTGLFIGFCKSVQQKLEAAPSGGSWGKGDW